MFHLRSEIPIQYRPPLGRSQKEISSETSGETGLGEATFGDNTETHDFPVQRPLQRSPPREYRQPVSYSVPSQLQHPQSQHPQPDTSQPQPQLQSPHPQ